MSVRVLGIAGSLRKDSYNAKLLRAATETAPSELTITPFTLGEVEPYNADVEARGDPPGVAALRGAVRGARALLFVSPEYNYGVPGIVKNAIDWMSRPPGHAVIERKPAAILGASRGPSGTMRMQTQLRLTLQSVEMYVMPKPEIFMSHCGDKFDEEGRLIDEGARERLLSFMAAFAAWISRFPS